MDDEENRTWQIEMRFFGMTSLVDLHSEISDFGFFSTDKSFYFHLHWFVVFTKAGQTWEEAECKNCTCNHDYTIECQEKPCYITSASSTPSTTPTTNYTTPVSVPKYCVANGVRYQVSQCQVTEKWPDYLISPPWFCYRWLNTKVNYKLRWIYLPFENI